MLTSAFSTHFQNLCESDFGEAGRKLEIAIKELSVSSAMRGIRGPSIAGLIEIYREQINTRAKLIDTNLRRAHGDFNSPLAGAIDEEILKIAESTFSNQTVSLFNSLERDLSRSDSLHYLEQLRRQLSLNEAATKAAMCNGIRNYLWELRNVPKRAPTSEAAIAPQTNINQVFGNVISGPHATANVQQVFNLSAVENLVDALNGLCAAIEQGKGLSEDDRTELVADVKAAMAEAREDAPSGRRLLKTIGGLGAVVQTLGSAQPAWAAVKAAARAFGLQV